MTTMGHMMMMMMLIRLLCNISQILLPLFTSSAEQFGQEKADKSTRTTTKTNLKDVVITDTVEGDIRKEHHGRDKNWKETGRNQIKSNTNFDMARALFT
jgi:hypothetical protein